MNPVLPRYEFRHPLPVPDLTTSQNRYRELLVVSRQYEATKNLIDFGFASQPSTAWKEPPAGSLVWKCVVCPRKTLDFDNLPKLWVNDPNEWRKFISLCYDGNFSGVHTISRQPGNNVPLFPGTGMFEHPDIISRHMAKAVDDSALRRIDPHLVSSALQTVSNAPIIEHGRMMTTSPVTGTVLPPAPVKLPARL